MKYLRFAKMVFAMALAAPAAASAQAGRNELFLSVSVEGEVMPDRADVRFSVSGAGSAVAKAQQELNAERDKIIAALTEAGVARSSITFVPASPARDAELGQDPGNCDAGESSTVDDPGCAVRYVRTGDVTIKLDDAEALKGLLNPKKEALLAILQGADRFELDNSDLPAARQAALAQAIAKARKEADFYAAGIGYRVDRVIGLGNGGPPLSMSEVIMEFSLQSRPNGRPTWPPENRWTVPVTVSYAMVKN